MSRVMNSVQSLVDRPFLLRPLDEQLQVKRLGRPMPNLDIEQIAVAKPKSFKRKFYPKAYQVYRNLCGCPIRKSLYCFPCLLFDLSYMQNNVGFLDLAHFSDKVRRHEATQEHIGNEIKLAMLGFDKSTLTLNSSQVKTHNDLVRKKRYALRKILDCIKFCYNCTKNLYAGQDAFLEKLVKFHAQTDDILKEVTEANEFSSNILLFQKALLESTTRVTREIISKEIREAEFFSFILEDISLNTEKIKICLYFRYERDGRPIDRFWGTLQPGSANEIFDILHPEITSHLPNIKLNPYKLSSYSFDGSVVFRNEDFDFLSSMREHFPNAQFSHCSYHDLVVIAIQMSLSYIEVRQFFKQLRSVTKFFKYSKHPKHSCLSGNHPMFADHVSMTMFLETIKQVNSRKDELLRCARNCARYCKDPDILSEAEKIEDLLCSENFLFFLQFFQKVLEEAHMVQINLPIIKESYQLSNVLQLFRTGIENIRSEVYTLQRRGNIEAKRKKNEYLEGIGFKQGIKSEDATDLSEINVKETEHAEDVSERKRIKTEDSVDVSESKRIKTEDALDAGEEEQDIDIKVAIGVEICDLLLSRFEDRFAFCGALNGVSLIKNSRLGEIPGDLVKEVIIAYPFMDKYRLKNELHALHSRWELESIIEPVQTFKFIRKSGLSEVLKESSRLLRVVFASPWVSLAAVSSLEAREKMRQTDFDDGLVMLNIGTDIDDEKEFFDLIIEDFAKNCKDERFTFKETINET